jgi:hypothetical protein
VRSGSRARRSRRELHERYVTVDRSVSRRTSSEAYKYTESSTIRRPDPQEELSPGDRDRMMGVPDPEHGCGTLDREHELESIPCSVQLDDRLSVSVSEATEDVILRDAVFANNDTVDGEQVDERSAVGTENSDLGDECIEPSHAEALCNITNSGLKITPMHGIVPYHCRLRRRSERTAGSFGDNSSPPLFLFLCTFSKFPHYL